MFCFGDVFWCRDTYRVKVVFDLSLRPYVLYVYYFSSFFHSFFSKLFSFFFLRSQFRVFISIDLHFFLFVCLALFSHEDDKNDKN